MLYLCCIEIQTPNKMTKLETLHGQIVKEQPPHRQIKALDAEIARLQNSLPNLDLKEFETTCERINQLEIKRVQLLNPIEFEAELPTYKILIK